MRTPSALLIVMALVVFGRSPLSAQIVAPPDRPTRPMLGGGIAPDANRPRQNLTIDLVAMGGHQGGLKPPKSALPVGFTAPGASIGVGNATVEYLNSTPARQFHVSGHAFAQSARQIEVVDSWGSDFTADMRTSVGRSANLAAFQSVQYTPYHSLGLFDAFEGIGGLGGGTVLNPDAIANNPLIDGRMWLSRTTASFDYKLTRSARTTARYSFAKRTDAGSDRLDNRTHEGSVTFDRRIGRHGNLHAAYRLMNADRLHLDRQSQARIQTVQSGVGFVRRISATRELSLAAGGGGQYVMSKDTVNQQYWLPTMHGSVKYDLGRSWSVALNYQQAANALPAPVFTPDTFKAHSVIVSAGGYVGNRVELVFNAGQSNGVIAGQTGDGRRGSYSGYTGTGQIRIRLTGWWSAVLSANRYEARLGGAASDILGISSRLYQKSVRVGLAWTIPVIQPARQGRRPAVRK
jgi:hypothetical protein